MDQRDYERIIKRYKSPFSPLPDDVLRDMNIMLVHVEAQNRLIAQLRRELEGAMKTMLAFTRSVAGGALEIPFALIDMLSPDDRLLISDVKTPHGLMKRFSYKSAEDASAEAATRSDKTDLSTLPRIH